ncbi:MAG TPA: hypothetical protein VJ739_10680 [Gemmataceae bacterium]|nr:hypothetical protein [Gemmataceae bacterium]
MTRRRRAGAVPGRLPQRLRPLFWDHDFGRLTWENDVDLLIGRILGAGDWDAVRWLLRRLPESALRDWLERRRGAGLSGRQLRFWELVLGLSRRQVDTWLADPAREVWEGRRRA